MFREKLKSDINKLRPSESIKSAVLESLNKKQEHKVFKFKPLSVIAACLAVIILLGTFCDRFIADYFIVDNALPPGVYTASKKQDMIYNAVIEGESSGTLRAQGYYDDFYSEYGYAKYYVSPSIDEGVLGYSSDINAEKHTYKAGITQSKGNKKSKNDNDYSDTNKQVQNVDEDDVVKTDGKYIYKLTNSYGIRIYIADGENTKPVSHITMFADEKNDENKIKIKSFYLCDDNLVVISEAQKYLYETECECRTCKTADLRYFTRISVYSLENIKSPVLEKTFEQSGIYENSRIIGDVLYLNSVYETCDVLGISDIKPDKNDKKLYMPLLCEDKETKIQDVDSIEIGKDLDVTDYSVLCSYDVSDLSRVDDVSFFGNIKIGYVSEKNIYFTEHRWYDENDDYLDQTEITRLQVDNGKITKKATGKIEGQILNQFTMDEKDDTLRVVSQLDNENAVYILDMELKHISAIENIAKGERLKSARFLGDYVYFVTFKEVDPLFCADLSNPKKPKILSELKIPGFSEYLHPFGENKLLGFGTNTGKNSWNYGLKLSMFDIKDPKKITEQNIEKIKSDYSEAQENHKAIIVEEEKNLIGFSSVKIGDYRDKYYYHIYSYDEKNGFKEKLNLVIDRDFEDENENYTKLRGLYIGDYFYIVGNGRIRVVDLNTFKVVK